MLLVSLLANGAFICMFSSASFNRSGSCSMVQCPATYRARETKSGQDCVMTFRMKVVPFFSLSTCSLIVRLGAGNGLM